MRFESSSNPLREGDQLDRFLQTEYEWIVVIVRELCQYSVVRKFNGRDGRYSKSAVPKLL
jgi:hypothetical protein